MHKIQHWQRRGIYVVFLHPVIHNLLQLVKKQSWCKAPILLHYLISVIYKIHSDVVRASFIVDKLLRIIR